MSSVLIVDDNLENRYLLRVLFEGNGYQVAEASNGLEALRTSRPAPPDAVITDLLMPEMDGFTFLREWKKDKVLSGIPLIVYTATYTDSNDRRLALDLGASDFIIKPAEPEALLTAVVSAVDKSTSAPPLAPTVEDADFFERYSQRLREKLDRKIDQSAASDKSLSEYVTRCESILAATSDAVISIDPNRRIRLWNLRAEDLFGFCEEEILNQSIEMLIPPKKRAEALLKLRESEEKIGSPVRFETQRIHKSGRQIDVEIALSYLGANVGYMDVISDLSEERRRAEEKKNLEEQLARAQRLESIGLLAGGIAHDFNNLLTVINYLAENIENDNEHNCPFRGDARRIREAGERAAALTRQLLAFSRRQVMKPEVFDLNDTVRSMGSMLRRLIRESIELAMELDETVGYVKMDRSQLEQVILNLAVNARDAMQDGGRLVMRTERRIIDEEQAKTYPSGAPGRFVVLSAIDNGVGMDRDILSRIFDPFFTTKSPGKGTGLGLATVHGIVHQSKGFIAVQSEPGEGSAFEIFLPSADAELPSKARPPVLPVGKAHGETVLVVEDDEAVRTVARRILKRAGYQVLEARGPDEAFAYAAQTDQPIHLLLTDVILSGINGRELSERIRTLRPDIKVVFTSGYTDDIVARHGVLEQGVTLVEKPFSEKSLTEVVRTILDSDHSPSDGS